MGLDFALFSYSRYGSVYDWRVIVCVLGNKKFIRKGGDTKFSGVVSIRNYYWAELSAINLGGVPNVSF